MAAARNPYSWKWWLVRKLTGGQIEAQHKNGSIFVVHLQPSGKRNTLEAKGWWK